MPHTKTRNEHDLGLLTYGEIARATTLSKSTVGRLVRSGQLKSVRFGPRSVRVAEDVLEEFLRQSGLHDDGDHA